jgi:hypothetical protein
LKQNKKLPLTAVWRNGVFSASYDSFEGKQTLVLRINICGENATFAKPENVVRHTKKHPSDESKIR